MFGRCLTMRPRAGSSCVTLPARPTAPSRNGRASNVLMTVETLLTGRELLRPGWIEISQGKVHAIGQGFPPRRAGLDLGAVTVVPGFVGAHVHGGGGANFATACPAETSAAVGLHLRHGTTT